MDRFLIRKPRSGVEYPQGNPMAGFTNIRAPNNMVERSYYGLYGEEGNMKMNQFSSNVNSPHFNQHTYPPHIQNQGPIYSGIETAYLSGFSNIPPNMPNQGHNFHNVPQMNMCSMPTNVALGNLGTGYRNMELAAPQRANMGIHRETSYGQRKDEVLIASRKKSLNENTDNMEGNRKACKQSVVSVGPLKQSDLGPLKDEITIQTTTRSDKLKALYKSGPRVFTAPVEKVLKWHKALQDIGVLVLFEIVAKCVSVRAGEGCSKVLVIRDDSGPAMQVVYYEIDFLLPELKLPCTVRAIGRMVPGSSRLHAFRVRVAVGGDVASLARRAAVAAHHVAKLAKDYGAAAGH